LLEGEKCEGKWFQTGSYKKKHIHNDHGNKKNKVVSLEVASFVLNLRHVQHISLGHAPREFYFSFLKGEHLLNTQS
jgi:hypothetical protein